MNEEDFASLTGGQRAAVHKVIVKMLEIKRCEGDLSKLSQVKPLRMIIAGTAGTGKTRVITAINSAGYFLLGPHSVKNVAPSGTAAFLMKGKTIHSLFPIPIGPGQYKPMKAPRADRLNKLQQALQGLTCLCLDERSMVGGVVFGWMEFMLRVGMNMGLTPNQEYGGLKILLLFGDDGQLPPVNASRLFSDKAQASNAGQAGQLQYSMIKQCIFLTDVVRQRGDPCYTCSTRWHEPGAECTRLRDFLLRLRYGNTSIGEQHYKQLEETEMEWLRERSSSVKQRKQSFWQDTKSTFTQELP
jgi:hypothetical protein